MSAPRREVIGDAELKVYCLSDPRADAIRYVGVTSGDIGYRVASHLQQAYRTPKRPVSRWMLALQAVCLLPAAHELEVVKRAEWQVAETFWIEAA